MRNGKIGLIIGMLIVLGTCGAEAQTHECDVASPPTSASATAGAPITLLHCHSGLDPNGNAVTGFAMYLDGVRSLVTMVRGATANATGLFAYTFLTSAPASSGVKTYETAALSGTLESPRSNPFALTVSLPRVAPVAPTKTQIRP